MKRRTVLWAAPAVLAAVAAPTVAASQTGECTASNKDVYAVLTKDTLSLTFLGSNAVDVTIRYGTHQHHANYVTQGKNPGDNQVLYRKGETHVIPLDGDVTWLRVSTIHLEDFTCL